MKQSAGLLLFRKTALGIEFFLVHPGGPFFARKDSGFWTIPKGEFTAEEDSLHAAVREFEEETGFKISGNFIPLRSIVQKGGKHILCWASEGNLDESKVISNEFEMEWPPGSGKMKSFPEIDKAGWFDFEASKKMINERQISFLEEVVILIQ